MQILPIQTLYVAPPRRSSGKEDQGMATMFVHHKVTDFAAWKQVYEGFMPAAKGMSLTAEAVYQAADDPNDVTVTHEFPTVEAALAFGASDALHAAMDKAGVVGAPTVWIANKA
jgi:hypothetical protein